MKSDKSVQDEEIVKLLKTSANPKVKRREIEADDFFYEILFRLPGRRRRQQRRQLLRRRSQPLRWLRTEQL